MHILAKEACTSAWKTER